MTLGTERLWGGNSLLKWVTAGVGDGSPGRGRLVTQESGRTPDSQAH